MKPIVFFEITKLLFKNLNILFYFFKTYLKTKVIQ